jgi:hypothetical protein
MGPDANQRLLDRNIPWLKERWAKAQEESESGILVTGSQWFFDPATDRQLDRIRKIGIRLPGTEVSKGQASDVIGLFEKLEDPDDEELLEFLGVPRQMWNRSRARHERGRLRLDPQKLAAFERRPAHEMQKEYFRFFGLTMPQQPTRAAAERMIEAHRERLTEEERNAWIKYTMNFEQFSDPTFRAEVGIKKVSLDVYREAAEALALAGDAKGVEDPYAIATKMLELRPGLKRDG